MKKIRFYSGLINLQIKWLDKMSDRGYRLVGTGKLWYEFEPCEPSAYRYAIDYVGDKSRAEAKEYAVFLFVCIVYLIDHLKMKKLSSLVEG
ncbi:MAG: DUF2812 domain-containing protein [Lachnospiraceae bacterium]|nr:DUF2812 domain-containing protein [Lachnospiraceae bacterium]